MGDSIADSGTFGFKFTVQGSAPTGPASTPVWPELVASNYGSTLCPRYVSTGSAFNNAAGCTNYAVGGGRINNFTAPASPVSIVKQLTDAGADGFSAGDLLLIDGGGNDAADLIGAYLSASKDGGKAFSALLSTLLPAATVNAGLAGGATGQAQVGGAYMVALADKFHDAIEANALNKGAQRVAVLNMPAIDKTPRLQQVLGGITATAGAAASAQVQGLLKAWLEAFNAQLDKRFAGNSKVVVVDCLESTQLARVQQRNQLAADAIQAIMAQQASRLQRLQKADWVLWNDTLSLQALGEQVRHLYNDLIAAVPDPL